MILSAASTQYVQVPVTAIIAGGAYDPTADPVAMAFTLHNTDPGPADWNTASWQTANGVHTVLCLVGPAGTITLPVGSYTVWVKVTDSPEIPVLNAGTLTIT